MGSPLTTAVKVKNGTLLNQAGHTDHPRDVLGQALLGDPRDDENRQVFSPLQCVLP